MIIACKKQRGNWFDGQENDEIYVLFCEIKSTLLNRRRRILFFVVVEIVPNVSSSPICPRASMDLHTTGICKMDTEIETAGAWKWPRKLLKTGWGIKSSCALSSDRLRWSIILFSSYDGVIHDLYTGGLERSVFPASSFARQTDGVRRTD